MLIVMQTALRLLLLIACAGHGCATSRPDATESAINARSRIAASVCGGHVIGGERTQHVLFVDGGTGKLLAVDIIADAGNPELAMCATSVLQGVQTPSTRRGLARIEVSIDWPVAATAANMSRSRGRLRRRRRGACGRATISRDRPDRSS